MPSIPPVPRFAGVYACNNLDHRNYLPRQLQAQLVGFLQEKHPELKVQSGRLLEYHALAGFTSDWLITNDINGRHQTGWMLESKPLAGIPEPRYPIEKLEKLIERTRYFDEDYNRQYAYGTITYDTQSQAYQLSLSQSAKPRRLDQLG